MEMLPVGLTGDCIPMSCDNGKTWCVEYDHIQTHPEKEWKGFAELVAVLQNPLSSHSRVVYLHATLQTTITTGA